MSSMNNSLRIKISNIIENNLSGYDYKNVYDKLEKVYATKVKYSSFVMKINIIGNIISYENTTMDNRKSVFIDLFDKTKQYISSTGREFSDCVIYLYVIDSYNYDYQDLPFFIIAKPNNKKGILIPDNTFRCHNMHQRCYDWDHTKKVVRENCDRDSDMDKCEKINKVFFRGANTGEDKHNLRGLLEKEAETTEILDVTIGSHQIPLYEFCKYKYLLNLPGHQPWSYRFKYLFLMHSLVINVDLRQNYGKSFNGTWINFFDSFFEDGVDYVNLVYEWYEKDSKKNEENYKILVQEIIDVHDKFENDQDAYKKMVDAGYKMATSITQDIIYEAVYMLVEAYAKKVRDANE